MRARMHEGSCKAGLCVVQGVALSVGDRIAVLQRKAAVCFA